MKQYLILVLIPVMFACQGNKEKIRDLESKNDSLKQAAEKKEEMINEFVSSFNEIEQNLSSIKEKEQMIRVNSKGEELSKGTKERINEDITSIYELLLKNRKKLKDLRSQLENSKYELEKFKKMANRLTNEVKAKNQEIDSLRNRLSELKVNVKNLNQKVETLNYDVDSLSSENKEKENIIKDKTEKMNTGYYVIGTEDELTENGVVKQSGGIFGLGSTLKLKKEFNEDYFTEIDIREKKNFPLFSKKAEIVTTHPKKAYKLTGTNRQIDSLIVENSDEFWDVSKYLVIAVKE